MRVCNSRKLDVTLLQACSELKQLTLEIDVVIHAIGILTALPAILEENEQIEYLSLGAGNTGREFDLETSSRIAEFKFINWRGGPESIRQNSLFKDFFWLAESDTTKNRYLYVLDTEKPLKFLNGKRALSSVTSKDARLAKAISERYGTRFSRVGDYYRFRKDSVNIVDVSAISPNLSELNRSK
jgi:hypothetical protein